MNDFTHLHVHTEFSMLDGLIKIPKLVEKVKNIGQKAVAITDHGNMHGAIAFYNECLSKDIKPIIGVEAYVAKKSRFDKQTKAGTDQEHLTLLAKDFQGYRNLMKLVTISNFEGFSYKPRIDEEVLFKYSKGVIVLSGCLNGVFANLAKQNKIDELLKKADKYKQIFKDNFYIELQRHPAIKDIQEPINKILLDVARKLNIPIVATNDAHYLDKTDALAQDALVAIGTRKLLNDKNRMSMADNPHLYIKTTQEMEALFSDLPEAIKNTQEITEKVNIDIPRGQLIFPNYELPEGETAYTMLRKMAYEGAKKKFKKVTKKVKDRIEYELDIIHTKGYDAYFLITQDFVNWAKTHGIRVGPGRGSAAGSLVSYCINITAINPLQHGLPFERFLNPQRPTPPDIDIDFQDDKRQEVIKYCARKYGHDHVAGVITFGKMEARVAVRDIGRILGIPYEEVDKIAKLIPNTPGKKVSIKKAIETIPELKEFYKTSKYKKLLDLASQVEGTVRHSSIHACAVIIADKPLPNYTPLQIDRKSNKSMTQYDMYSLDCNINDNAIGLLKFDFLGLRNLTIIQKALELIKQYKNIELKLDEIPLDDKPTYELISSGETTGVFQLESSGMRRVAKTLRPNQFSDITAMLALYRPGPMELIPKFIEGKHNPNSIEYPHPSLEPVLKETYGIMVYQEQILQIANIMAGYSLGEADILRRAIGKKKKKLLDKNKKIFIQRAIEKKYTKEDAEKVWGYIEAFANYGFNKSHAASYAMISYQTAYLKAHFPVEYMAALMSVESNSKSATRDEKIAIAIEDSKRMGIIILPPDINKSTREFSIEKHPDSLQGLAIRFGLSAIKNVGEAAIENILEVRKKIKRFTSFTQFLHLVDTRKVNKKVLESLIKVGAFDEFATRATLLENLDEIKNKALTLKSEIDGQDNLFVDVKADVRDIKDNFPILPEYPKQELLSFEKELLGIYLTSNPFSDALKLVEQYATIKIGKIDEHLHKDKTFLIGGVITNIRYVKTKKTNKDMCFGTIEDDTGKARFVVFPDTFEKYKDKLKQNSVCLIKALVSLNDGELNLIVQSVKQPPKKALQISKRLNRKEIFIPRNTTKQTLKKLGELLKSHIGNDKVSIIIPTGDTKKVIDLPYGVRWSDSLEEQINELLRLQSE